MDENRNRTIIGFKAENFKRLEAVEIHPTATGLVEIRGRNAQGKSCVLDAIAAALGGLRDCPQVPIRIGEESATVLLDLGDIVVKRRWTDPVDGSRSAVTIETAEGALLRSPQSLLDRLVAEFADPAAFAALSPRDQVRAVFSLVDLGIDLEASRAAEDQAERDRLLLGREERALAGEVAGLREAAGSAPPAGRIDLADLMGQVEAAHEHNGLEPELRAAMAEAQRGLRESESYVVELRAQQVGLRDRILELERQAEALSEVTIPQAEEGREIMRARAETADANLVAFARVDTAELRQQIARAEATNRHADAVERLRDREADLAAKRAEHAAADQRVQTIRDERRAALESVAWPVPGLGFDAASEELTLAGVPFAQASQSERLRASALLAMARDASIRVLFVREGSLLDDAAKAALADLVAERGWQLWCEVVANADDGVGVWIEEGKTR